MRAFHFDNVAGVFKMFDPSPRGFTPQESPARNGLVFSVDTNCVMRCSSPKITAPERRAVVTIGARVDEKLLAAVAEPKTEGIRMPVGAQRWEPQGACVKYRDYFIFATTILGEH